MYGFPPYSVDLDDNDTDGDTINEFVQQSRSQYETIDDPNDEYNDYPNDEYYDGYEEWIDNEYGAWLYKIGQDIIL